MTRSRLLTALLTVPLVLLATTSCNHHHTASGPSPSATTRAASPTPTVPATTATTLINKALDYLTEAGHIEETIDASAVIGGYHLTEAETAQVYGATQYLTDEIVQSPSNLPIELCTPAPGSTGILPEACTPSRTELRELDCLALAPGGQPPGAPASNTLASSRQLAPVEDAVFARAVGNLNVAGDCTGVLALAGGLKTLLAKHGDLATLTPAGDASLSLTVPPADSSWLPLQTDLTVPACCAPNTAPSNARVPVMAMHVSYGQGANSVAATIALSVNGTRTLPLDPPLSTHLASRAIQRNAAAVKVIPFGACEFAATGGEGGGVCGGGGGGGGGGDGGDGGTVPDNPSGGSPPVVNPPAPDPPQTPPSIPTTCDPSNPLCEVIVVTGPPRIPGVPVPVCDPSIASCQGGGNNGENPGGGGTAPASTQPASTQPASTQPASSTAAATPSPTGICGDNEACKTRVSIECDVLGGVAGTAAATFTGAAIIGACAPTGPGELACAPGALWYSSMVGVIVAPIVAGACKSWTGTK